MKSAILFLLLVSVCVALASPSFGENRSLVRHRRQSLDLFSNTRRLIEELVTNLNKAALQARDAVVQFNNGLLEQAKRCRERFMSDLSNLRNRVSESIKAFEQTIVNSSSAVGECITTHRHDAEAILQQASDQTLACADSRVKEAGELIRGLSSLGEDGIQIANHAAAEMRNCTQEHSGNILGVGTCLGTTAIRTEVQGASYLMQSGLAIARLNLFMATLPASLEICAGSSLVNAGVGTAKVLMEIGSCSTNSVLNNFGINLVSNVDSVASNPTSSISEAVANTASLLPSLPDTGSISLPFKQ